MKYFTVFFLLLSGFFLMASNEAVLFEKNFDPLVELNSGYYVNVANIRIRDWIFSSDTKFTINAELENGPDVMGGMKLRQIYQGRKDALADNLFWNAKGGPVTGSCKLNRDGTPGQLMQLQLFFYNIKKNGSLKLKSVKLTAENITPKGYSVPALPPLLEQTFSPPLKVKGHVPVLDLPLPTELSNDSQFTIEAVITGPEQSRVGLRLRRDLCDSKSTYSNFFWNYPLKADEDNTIIRILRLPHDPRTTKLVLIATDCGTSEIQVKSLRVFHENKPRDPNRGPTKYPKDTFTSLEYQPNYFPVGTYLYGSKPELEKLAAIRKLSLEQYLHAIFKDMANHGCNVVYSSGISTDPEFVQKFCAIAAEYQLKVFLQANGPLYLQPERGREYFDKISAPAYRKRLAAYGDIPNLAAFLPKEEITPSPEQLEILGLCRQLLRELMPKVPLFTLHNLSKSMELDTHEPQPEWYGFDRYRFRVIKVNNERVISTPREMVSLLSAEIQPCYQLAASRGRPLLFVAQGYKAEAVDKIGGPRSGFREVTPGQWRGYDRYMPKNGMNLQYYLSLAHGVRGFLVYFYQTKPSELRCDGLAGLDGSESFYWREMGECVAETKIFFPLFIRWFREFKSTATANDPWVICSSFVRPDLKGRFILPVNTHIADWDKNCPPRPSTDTQLKSDAENLQGFEWAVRKTFKLKLDSPEKLWHLRSGKEAARNAITLEPGKGDIFFLGSLEELKKIRTELNL